MSLVFPSVHPLISHKLSLLRAEHTRPPEFRRLVRELTQLLAYEATLDLPLRPRDVMTPLGISAGHRIESRIAIVPILRAGLGMAEGLLDLIPDAEVWHLGLKRDEITLLPAEYYCRLPKRVEDPWVMIVDPMLATGGSAVHACSVLSNAGVKRIKYLSLIAAPEGIAQLSKAMPEMPIHVGVIDERLTDVGFIYPGLGDAGDRQFATFED